MHALWHLSELFRSYFFELFFWVIFLNYFFELFFCSFLISMLSFFSMSLHFLNVFFHFSRCHHFFWTCFFFVSPMWNFIWLPNVEFFLTFFLDNTKRKKNNWFLKEKTCPQENIFYVYVILKKNERNDLPTRKYLLCVRYTKKTKKLKGTTCPHDAISLYI